MVGRSFNGDTWEVKSIRSSCIGHVMGFVKNKNTGEEFVWSYLNGGVTFTSMPRVVHTIPAYVKDQVDVLVSDKKDEWNV